MASEAKSRTVVAPGFDILFEFVSNYGLAIILFASLVLLGYVMWNVTHFIPNSAWTLPSAAPAPK